MVTQSPGVEGGQGRWGPGMDAKVKGPCHLLSDLACPVPLVAPSHVHRGHWTALPSTPCSSSTPNTWLLLESQKAAGKARGKDTEQK